MAIDPVCGMPVDDETQYVRAVSGREYRFCSEGCLAEFERHPEEYVADDPAEEDD